MIGCERQEAKVTLSRTKRWTTNTEEIFVAVADFVDAVEEEIARSKVKTGLKCTGELTLALIDSAVVVFVVDFDLQEKHHLETNSLSS